MRKSTDNSKELGHISEVSRNCIYISGTNLLCGRTPFFPHCNLLLLLWLLYFHAFSQNFLIGCLQFIILLFTCRYSSNSGAWLGFESTRICPYADKDVVPTIPTPRSHDSSLSMYRYNCFTCKHQVWTWNQALSDTTTSAHISFPWFLS